MNVSVCIVYVFNTYISFKIYASWTSTSTRWTTGVR